MGKWNRLNFVVLTIAREVYDMLKELKKEEGGSFNDVLRRLLKRDQEGRWSFIVPVAPDVRSFWEEPNLFG